MKIIDYLNEIKNLPNYVPGSLYLKSYDDYGAVYKYLVELPTGFAIRKEYFLALDPEEYQLPLEERTILKIIEICPAK